MVFLICLLFISDYSVINTLTERVTNLEDQVLASQNGGCSAKESISKATGSVVRIVGGDGEGSGFAIERNGLILTNFHVIADGINPKVILPDRTFQTATIVLASKVDDLAFLKIEKDLPTLPMGDSSSLSQADEVYAMGFPFGGDLPGEMTVKKGIVSGKRYFKETNGEFIQTDSTLNPGLSGGPMINSCGQVIGINTLGGTGFGFAISSATILSKWEEMKAAKVDPLSEINPHEIEVNVDPLRTVQAYYSYIQLRQHEKAFELLGEYKKDFKYANWIKGYANNLDTTITSSEVSPENPNKINVTLLTLDLVDGDIVYRYFQGYWIVKKVDGKFLLWDPSITKF